MTTDEEECDDHEQWQPQKDAQAYGVEEALLVFGQDGVPNDVEEGADFLHGAWLDWGQRKLSAR